jgi:hypothetical protein
VTLAANPSAAASGTAKNAKSTFVSFAGLD